jgi:beta-galactosidase
MNCDVWVNDKMIGTHPYGYTAFNFDITRFLNPAGKANVIAFKVKNESQNSRWYSGSVIYRHVWLIQKRAVHIAHTGVFFTTEKVSSIHHNVRNGFLSLRIGLCSVGNATVTFKDFNYQLIK